MNGIQIGAAALAVISIVLLCLCGTPKRSKYLVTYEASLTAGGWTHGEVTLTTATLNGAAFEDVRTWIKSSRTDITGAVCIICVVKLDDAVLDGR
jgi:hypothetical protein